MLSDGVNQQMEGLFLFIDFSFNAAHPDDHRTLVPRPCQMLQEISF